MAVHIFSIVMASLLLVPFDWIPKPGLATGCEAYPMEGERGQHIFYWAFFMPMTTFIPVLRVTYLWFDIWWRELLPVNGMTRSLVFYFARLLAVIYLVTIAVTISFFFGGWVQAIAFVIFNLVGLLSVCLALMKNDIWKCWVQMWTCQTSDVLTESTDHPDDSTEPDIESGIVQKKDVSMLFPHS